MTITRERVYGVLDTMSRFEPLWWLVFFAIVLLLAGCGVDRGDCLASHSEPYEWMLPVQVGSTPCGNGCSVPIYVYVPVNDTRTVCDKWEFPEGRPQ